MIELIKIKRVDLKNEAQKLDDKVVAEVPLTIILNNEELSTLLCSPDKLKELTIGYLLAEGFINTLEDIARINLDHQRSVVRLETTNPVDKTDWDKKRIITSGCGRGQTFYNFRDFSHCKPIKSNLRVKAILIADLMKEFQNASKIFKETGGIHSAALCEKNKIVAFSEDIGRHNAVDKIIGEVVLQGESLKDKFLILSGRISSEITLKAVRLGVPLIVSRSAPTDMAVRLAKQLKVTLVGFARGSRMNVYSEEGRIVCPK